MPRYTCTPKVLFQTQATAGDGSAKLSSDNCVGSQIGNARQISRAVLAIHTRNTVFRLRNALVLHCLMQQQKRMSRMLEKKRIQNSKWRCYTWESRKNQETTWTVYCSICLKKRIETKHLSDDPMYTWNRGQNIEQQAIHPFFDNTSSRLLHKSALVNTSGCCRATPRLRHIARFHSDREDYSSKVATADVADNLVAAQQI